MGVQSSSIANHDFCDVYPIKGILREVLTHRVGDT